MKVNLSSFQLVELAKQWLLKKIDGNDIVRNKTVFLSKVDSNKAYLNCCIIVDTYDRVSAYSFAYCQFLLDLGYGIQVSSKIQFSFCRNYNRLGVAEVLDSQTNCRILRTLHVCSEITVSIEEAHYTVYGEPLISYNGHHFSFDISQITAGVELELPVFFQGGYSSKGAPLNGFWFRDVDCSQQTGNLELQSIPVNIEYLLTGFFRRRINSVYKKFVSNNSTLSEEVFTPTGTRRGSGIHMHIGFANQYFDAEDFRTALYAVTAELGGKDFLMSIGGKKEDCFESYSDYLPEQQPTAKYQSFRVVPTLSLHLSQLEIRHMASSIDPNLVIERIQATVSLVERALAWLEARECDRLTKSITELSMLKILSSR